MLERLEVISIRVPRTGSSSFSALLDRVYPSAELWNFIRHMKFNPKIYDPHSWFYQDPNPSAPFQAELEGFVPYNDLQYVHNHVPLSFFDGLWESTPRITFLREPTSWLISCFWFAKALGHIPSDMGIWDYIEIDYRQNWMTMLVGDINQYDFIGFQETWWNDAQMYLDRFVGNTYTMLITDLTKNVQTDQAYLRLHKDLKKDKMFIRRCKKLHKEDYKLYEEAKNVFAAR